MFNRPNGSGVPNLVIARRVLDKMMAAAQHHIEDETGEAMVGLVVPGAQTNGPPTLYVLDTISPDDSAIRQFHTFQQGDEHQDELIWWLQENWQQGRARLRSAQPKWDVPLRYLGDWHKQPGLMIQPSSGDLMTALDWLDDPDNHMDFLLAPIVTFGPAHSGASANYLVLPQPNGTALRVDFWYIDNQVRLFSAIVPSVYPNEQLPELVEYPWHLLKETRFAAEMRALEDDGLFITMVLYDVDDQPPLEICFLTARVGADKMLILVTKVDYPQTAPQARVAPLIPMQPDDDMFKVFEKAWLQSEPVDFQPTWAPDMMLVDTIHAVEAHLGLSAKSSEESS